MDGAIKVESKEGVGTKIKLDFPLILNASINKNIIQNTTENRKKMSYQNLDRINILLIEDEKLIYESLIKYLENSNAKVLSTQNGIEGFSLFKENFQEIDLVILDINLPGMNGVELYYKIKEILPGLVVATFVGLVSMVLSNVIPKFGAATISIFSGMFVGNVFLNQDVFQKGYKFSETNLLAYSIVLLGATLSISTLIELGFNGILFVVLQMSSTIIGENT